MWQPRNLLVLKPTLIVNVNKIFKRAKDCSLRATFQDVYILFPIWSNF